MLKNSLIILTLLATLVSPLTVFAQTEFNPHFIISDPELEDYLSWTRNDIQQFLTAQNSYLKNYTAPDYTGIFKSAADIIYESAQRYRINPKFLLVTLQKEQSLITTKSPTQKQLDWATGYAICDSCSMNDPNLLKFKGFGKQVDNAAGLMRWYYDNRTTSGFIKQKDIPILINNTPVTPLSWATAFLYTYTPHLHGNQNFWRIWNAWFEQTYPNGTVLASESGDYWLIQNGNRRKFSNKSVLLSRVDPKKAVTVSETELSNYAIGAPIAFANYSLLRTPSRTYLVDYDTLRPFASDAVVRKLGFNPQELIDVAESDLSGYTMGTTITESSTAPQGVIYHLTSHNKYYLLKDNVLFPIVDASIIANQYKQLPIEKHSESDLAKFTTATELITFADGTLISEKGSTRIYVMDGGKKRPIPDTETFNTLGYKQINVVATNKITLLGIPTGEALFASATASASKVPGKQVAQTDTTPDLFKETNLDSYLVAEYPSGKIISGKNILAQLPIGSLTKLLTGYEALQTQFAFDKTTFFDPGRYNAPGNTLNYTIGDTMSNKDLFYTMLVTSDNSAARMVAAGTNDGEKGLVPKINNRLALWKTDNTVIADVTGQDDQNVSTAKDLLTIFTKVMGHETMVSALGQSDYTINKTSQVKKTAKQTLRNSNGIIGTVPLAKRSYRITTTKTSSPTDESASLIMLVENKRTKQRYVIITLGNPDAANPFATPHKIAEWVVTTKL